MPPSITISWPVMKDAAGVARKPIRAAISSGVPALPGGEARAASTSAAVEDSVATQPGATAFTVIPCFAHSIAITFVIWLIPPLLHAYASWLFIPTAPNMEETLITLPRPRRKRVRRQRKSGP